MKTMSKQDKIWYANKIGQLIFIVAGTIVLMILNSCVEKITVTGQYGEYSFKPRKAIAIEESK
jgi:hypothetical protein